MLRNRVEQQTLTSGAGPYTLDNSVVGRKAFANVYPNGAVVRYTVESLDGSLFETNQGVLNSGVVPPQLSRARLISSTTGSAIVWPDASAKRIFVDADAELFGPLGGQLIFGAAGGSVDAITVVTDVETPVLVNGMMVWCDLTGPNTVTNPTFALNATGSKTIVLPDGAAPAIGDLAARRALFSYKASTDKWIFHGQPRITDIFAGTLTSTDPGAGGGPDFISDRNSASPAASDVLGRIYLRGRDSGANPTDYVFLTGQIVDPTNGSESGRLYISGLNAGAVLDMLTIGPGVKVGAAAGGDKGPGTLNAVGLYAGGAGVAGALLHCQDQKTSGTDGGGFTSGSGQVRTLNTKVTDEIGVTLSSNQIQGLPAGTYYIEAEAAALQVNAHKLFLRNVTDATTILVGANADDGTSAIQSLATLRGRFTIAGTKTFELQHRCGSTKATDGFGQNSGFGSVEIYADVKIWKVG